MNASWKGLGMSMVQLPPLTSQTEEDLDESEESSSCSSWKVEALVVVVVVVVLARADLANWKWQKQHNTEEQNTTKKKRKGRRDPPPPEEWSCHHQESSELKELLLLLLLLPLPPNSRGGHKEWRKGFPLIVSICLLIIEGRPCPCPWAREAMVVEMARNGDGWRWRARGKRNGNLFVLVSDGNTKLPNQKHEDDALPPLLLIQLHSISSQYQNPRYHPFLLCPELVMLIPLHIMLSALLHLLDKTKDFLPL